MYEIYGTQNCTFCHKAQQLLTQHDKPYTFIDVAEDEDITAAFFKRFPGVRTVPQIWIDDEHIGGYDELMEWLFIPTNAPILEPPSNAE